MSQANSRTAPQITSLYEAHAADAFRYALHLTGRREDAEDVVQYVFLQAYSSLEAGRELVNPRAWLMKATKHRSLNLIRDRRDVPAAEVLAPGTPAADAGEAAALADVRASLWSLPETQHHAFVLRHWSGLSQDEIADVLATTPGAVESLLVRARATLVAEHEGGAAECTGVRERLVRMLAPTQAHELHMASCHRCRTAQARLMRASGFAAALVPGPQVAHALAAAIPGFGVSGAAAGTAAGAGAAGSGAGAGAGGAAVSTASLATKAGIAAKLAVVATTAVVAVTAVHPVRSAVSHALLGTPAPTSAASSSPQASAHAASAPPATGPGASAAPAGGSRRKGAASGTSGAGGSGQGHGHGGKGQGAPASSGGPGAGKGKSGTAGSNGNGNGQGGASSAGSANGRSASAPGQTKAPGSAPATGTGQSSGGSTSGSGGSSNAGGNGSAGGGSNAGGNGGGSRSSAGGNGKGTS